MGHIHIQFVRGDTLYILLAPSLIFTGQQSLLPETIQQHRKQINNSGRQRVALEVCKRRIRIHASLQKWRRIEISTIKKCEQTEKQINCTTVSYLHFKSVKSFVFLYSFMFHVDFICGLLVLFSFLVLVHALHLGDGINALNGCLLKEIAPPLLHVHSCFRQPACLQHVIATPITTALNAECAIYLRVVQEWGGGREALQLDHWVGTSILCFKRLFHIGV